MIFNGKNHDHFYYGGQKWRQDDVEKIGKTIILTVGTSLYDCLNGIGAPSIFNYFDGIEEKTVTGVAYNYLGSLMFQVVIFPSETDINSGRYLWVHASDVKII
ncbi:hypothetical protein [Lactobacillus sp. ESL0703]|uniref:hypothetical protein n=1 Tax=Lactobacillus sp. ESL0703 TaxID=2983218 RepID=UPI0023F835EA|nr:hypothetical protein [Lactobacillus sp. ESL0703]